MFSDCFLKSGFSSTKRSFWGFRSAFTLMLLLLQTTTSLAATMSFNSGSISRVADPSEINISLTLTSINPADLATDGGDIKKTLYRRLKFYFPKHPNADYVGVRAKYSSEPASTTTSAIPSTLPGMTIIFTSAVEPKIQSDGQIASLKLNLRIVDSNSPHIISSMKETTTTSDVTKTFLTLQVVYSPANTQTESELKNSYTIDVINAVAKENPTSIVIEPAFKALEVSWASKETITYNDGVTRAPEGVVIYAIDLSELPRAEGVTGLAAITYKAAIADESVDTTCAFSSDLEAETCSLDCSPLNSVYLSKDHIVDRSEIKIFEQASDYNSVTVTNLDPEKSYAIIAQYEPNSIGSYECKIGKPIINFSLNEMNNTNAVSKKGNPACFIATAAYGSPLDKRISALRWFRDSYLLKHHAGRYLVAKYYKYSPFFAEKIESYPILKRITQALLWAPVNIISFMEKLTR